MTTNNDISVAYKQTGSHQNKILFKRWLENRNPGNLTYLRYNIHIMFQNGLPPGWQTTRSQ